MKHHLSFWEETALYMGLCLLIVAALGMTPLLNGKSAQTPSPTPVSASRPPIPAAGNSADTFSHIQLGAQPGGVLAENSGRLDWGTSLTDELKQHPDIWKSAAAQPDAASPSDRLHEFTAATKIARP